MTDTDLAVATSDMIRDTFEDAERRSADGDTYLGSMLIEGHCRDFADMPDLPMPGTAGFTFTQDRVRYSIHVMAEKLPYQRSHFK